MRDYIHVVDLAKGHVKALEKMMGSQPEVRIYNLGTGVGYSVLDVLHAYEKACGKTLPYKICPRRAGRYRHLLLRLRQGGAGAGLEGRDGHRGDVRQ